MGCAVGAHEARAIDGEGHGQILDANVVDDLIVGPLEKGGVDGDYGFGTLAGKPGCQGNRMLLGDGDIKISFRELLREGDHV